MFDLIYGSIDRQARALSLLGRLLQEEFQFLCDRNMDEVMRVEFSVHELIRQLANEKDFVKRHLGGGKLKDYIAMLDEERAEGLQYVFSIVGKFEQKCSRQASRNAELSLALLDSATDSVKFMQDQLIPTNTDSYSRHGSFSKAKKQASIVSGRL